MSRKRPRNPHAKPATPRNPGVRRLAFLDAYQRLGFANATQAAIDAGYSARSARVLACRLLKRPDIITEVERRKQLVEAATAKAVEKVVAERVRKAAMTRDQVARELKLIGMSSHEHYDIADNGRVILRNGAPRGAMRAVSKVKVRKRTVHTDKGSIETVETEYALWNKNNALQQTRELEGYDVPPPASKGAQAGAVIEVLGGPMGFEVRAAVAVRTGTDH